MELKFTNRENECTKTADGRTIWIGRSVAVAAQVLFFDESGWNDVKSSVELNPFVIIVKRGPASLGEPGKWCFPCGYIDWDETGREAAIRETYEESGANIRDLVGKDWNETPWYVDSSPKHHRQNITMHHGFILSSDYTDLPVLTNQHAEEGEISDVRWVRAHEVATEYDMAFEHNLIIKKLISEIYKAPIG